MAKIKINNKNYDIPQLGYGHMMKLESEGINVVDMFRKNQIFSLAGAFIIIVTDCSMEDAGYLAEQHVMGGGDIAIIHEAFLKAIDESSFFKKLLGIEEEQKQTPRKTVAK